MSSLTALEPGYPVWDPVWVRGKGPRRGPAGTWVVGGAPLPVGLRLHGLCQRGLQEAPQGSQATVTRGQAPSRLDRGGRGRAGRAQTGAPLPTYCLQGTA